MTCPAKRSHRSNKGFTLLELVIALGIWMLLSAGVFVLWQHASRTSMDLIDQQGVLENARVAMDVIVRNMEMAPGVTIVNHSTGVLDTVEIPAASNLLFLPGVGTLNIGGAANPVAYGIGAVYLTYVPGRRVEIAVYTACEEPLVLYGSVDVRYKNVMVTP